MVDVFSDEPYRGNPLAVVLDADDLGTEQMQRLACWINLSETTFLLRPTEPTADYRVRIFTTTTELPFAGHPTLGTCAVWLSQQGSSMKLDVVVQECEAGLVQIKRVADQLAFRGPPLIRSGPVEAALLDHIAEVLRIERSDIVDSNWVDNGPGWVAVLLPSVEAVLKLRPASVDLDLGVVAPYPAGSPEAFEIRAFFPKDGVTVEDPVTGSLNASVAQWLIGTGRARAPYIVSQGTALGRRGRVEISTDEHGAVWVAGRTNIYVAGTVELS